MRQDDYNFLTRSESGVLVLATVARLNINIRDYSVLILEDADRMYHYQRLAIRDIDVEFDVNNDMPYNSIP